MPKVPLKRINPKAFLPAGYTEPELGPPDDPMSITLPPGIRKNRSMGTYSGSLSKTPRINLDNISGTKPGINWQGVLGKAQSVGNTVAPFISNIANAFRKPPKPALPYLNSFTNLNKVNFDDERNRVSRAVSSADASVDRNLPSNAGAAVKAANLGTKLNQLSSINEKEANINTQIGNQQAEMDLRTQYVNNEKRDEYNDLMVQSNVAQQREQSQNLSNAADKYVSIRNENDKRKIDLSKTQTMLHAFDGSGVDKALRYKMFLNNEVDPTGQDFADVKDGVKRKQVFKTGGRISTKKVTF
jgi:hypothetical protein